MNKITRNSAIKFAIVGYLVLTVLLASHTAFAETTDEITLIETTIENTIEDTTAQDNYLYTLNKTSLELKVGESETLKIEPNYTLADTTFPMEVNNISIDWSTSNSEVVTVNDNGKVTAVAVGEATVTAKLGNGHDDLICNVSVTAASSASPGTYDRMGDIAAWLVAIVGVIGLLIAMIVVKSKSDDYAIDSAEYYKD